MPEPIEQTALGFFVGFLAVRITIAHANQFALAGHLKADLVFSSRHRSALSVQYFNSHNRDVFSISVNCGPIGAQLDRFRLTGGLAFFGEHHLSILRSARFNHARFVLHLPFKMGQRLNFLAALALAIQKELNFIKIRVHPNADDLAFAFFPIPVWK